MIKVSSSKPCSLLFWRIFEREQQQQPKVQKKKNHFSLFNREQIWGTIQEKSIYSMFSHVIFFIFTFKVLLWYKIHHSHTKSNSLDTRVVFTEFSEYGNNSRRGSFTEVTDLFRGAPGCQWNLINFGILI